MPCVIVPRLRSSIPHPSSHRPWTMSFHANSACTLHNLVDCSFFSEILVLTQTFCTHLENFFRDLVLSSPFYSNFDSCYVLSCYPRYCLTSVDRLLFGDAVVFTANQPFGVTQSLDSLAILRLHRRTDPSEHRIWRIRHRTLYSQPLDFPLLSRFFSMVWANLVSKRFSFLADVPQGVLLWATTYPEPG